MAPNVNDKFGIRGIRNIIRPVAPNVNGIIVFFVSIFNRGASSPSGALSYLKSIILLRYMFYSSV